MQFTKVNYKNTISGQILNRWNELLSVKSFFVFDGKATVTPVAFWLSDWLSIETAKYLKTFANEPIPLIVMIQIAVAYNCWQIEDAEFVVVRDGLKTFIGRNFCDGPGISLSKTLNHNDESTINNITTQCTFKIRIATQFPNLIYHGLYVLIVKSKCHKRF